ncbi:hypothetical protein M2322_004584 [Rhodoblastus acidophilus]|nr:hypothetical protein [Rhodoblastus acidophilus]
MRGASVRIAALQVQMLLNTAKAFLKLGMSTPCAIAEAESSR